MFWFSKWFYFSFWKVQLHKERIFCEFLSFLSVSASHFSTSLYDSHSFFKLFSFSESFSLLFSFTFFLSNLIFFSFSLFQTFETIKIVKFFIFAVCEFWMSSLKVWENLKSKFSHEIFWKFIEKESLVHLLN